MLKFVTSLDKKKLTNSITILLIFSLGYSIFNTFNFVKAETISSSYADNLLKASLLELPPLQSNKTKSTQNDTNYLHNLLILYNANIIDGNSKLRSNSTIIISGNRIIEVIDKDSPGKYYFYKKYTNSVLIDLSGKYIIPGLFDMHAHVAGVMKNSFNQTYSNEALQRLLDYGITTIRNPGGPTESICGFEK